MNTRRLFLAGLAPALIALLSACAEAPPPAAPPVPPTAERILLDARIWTGDPERPAAEALAIGGDRILAIGSRDEVMVHAGPDTRIESLAGRRVLPGFHDAHWHLPARPAADLAGAGDVAAVIERLQDFAATLPADAWLLGRGWTPDMFPELTAHRRFLDEAFPDRPVVITDRDGHLSLANSHALGLAGVDAQTADPPGGEVARDPDGSPSGVLKETAMGLVSALLPPLDPEQYHAALQSAMAEAARLGITALQQAHEPRPAEAEAYHRALAEGTLRTRVRLAVRFDHATDEARLAEYLALAQAHDGPLLRYGIAKGMLDGTVDGATAAMLEPLAGDHDHSHGIAMWEQDALDDMVARFDAAGLQVQLHAIGDRAVRMALDAFEHAARVNGARDHRHRVEHVEVADPADLPRFAALGVIASMQPIFATPDSTTLGSYAPMLGPERASRANAFRLFEEAGATLAFGSDYPVFPMDPLLGIYTAVTRQTPEGVPPGGWFPEHRIALESALRHYTWGSAYAAFREHELGVLAPGMLADFVVLTQDIFDAPASRLLETRPVLTVMGGQDTWRDESAL